VHSVLNWAYQAVDFWRKKRDHKGGRRRGKREAGHMRVTRRKESLLEKIGKVHQRLGNRVNRDRCQGEVRNNN